VECQPAACGEIAPNPIQLIGAEKLLGELGPFPGRGLLEPNEPLFGRLNGPARQIHQPGEPLFFRPLGFLEVVAQVQGIEPDLFAVKFELRDELPGQNREEIVADNRIGAASEVDFPVRVRNQHGEAGLADSVQ
jgi:hypothetical protein